MATGVDYQAAAIQDTRSGMVFVTTSAAELMLKFIKKSMDLSRLLPTQQVRLDESLEKIVLQSSANYLEPNYITNSSYF